MRKCRKPSVHQGFRAFYIGSKTALRSALPFEVMCEKTSNDAIAYSCKKIGHFYSAYFLHNRFLKIRFFVFCVTIFGSKIHSGCRATARPSCIRRTAKCDAGSLPTERTKKECSIASNYHCNVALIKNLLTFLFYKLGFVISRRMIKRSIIH